MSPTRTLLSAVSIAMTALLAEAVSFPAAGYGEKTEEAPRSFDAKLDSGALWRARVPNRWNGTLLLFSHGYAPTLRTPDLAPQGLEELLLQAGYALAASSYSAPGWALAEAVPDQLATLDAFISRFGKPKRTIAWGSSMGGLVTIALAEQHPERIDAAMPSCGSLAGSLGMMNEALNGAFAFKVLLAGDTDLRLVAVDDDLANAARVAQVVERAVGTAQGRARLALASALAQLPRWAGVQTAPPLASDIERPVDEAASVFAKGVFLPRVDQERRAGGVFSWNTGIDYRVQLASSGREAWIEALYAKAGLDLQQDLNTLNAAPRIAADPHAVAYMRTHYVPSGRLRVPVFSYHTIGDGMTVVEQQGAYRQRAEDAGRSSEFATGWVMRAGHCAFTQSEHWAALKTIEDRLAHGVWRSSPSELNARAAALPAPSEFVDFSPASFLRACDANTGACLGEPAAQNMASPVISLDALYPELIKSSHYVAVADGTQIALDIYRPARSGIAVETPLPVVLLHSLGARSDPRMLTSYGTENLVRHGYVFVWMQPRGTGASYGKTGGFLTAQNGRDVRDIIAWLAKQPWSTGKIGMMGLSNLGFIQWLAASERPPGLMTIVPAVANPDFYYQLYPNGVSALVGAPGMTNRPSAAAPATSAPVAHPVNEPPIQPVDEDPAPDYPLWHSAQRAHAGGLTLPDAWLVNMMRDQMNPALGYAPGLVDSPLPEHADALRASGIRIYQMAGWADASPGGEIIAHRDFGTKLIIGAWPHGLMAEDQGGPLLRAEHLRWFDFTLKGIDNGIEKEPAVRYQTQNVRSGDGWHVASRFPIPEEQVTEFYFGAGPAATVASVNDGTLTRTASGVGDASDAYRVAFDVAAFGGAFNRLKRSWDGDMAVDVDRRALTYTGAPLTQDIEVTGFPVAHLWLSADAPDADLIVYLEEVSPEGRSHFVTDGAARASHRLPDERAPWSAVPVPFHRSFTVDRRLLAAGEPVEVDFALTPISYVFRRGSRIRFTITGAEKNTYQPPAEIDPNRPLTLRIYRDKQHGSRVDLPFVNRR
jgi:putative CocE/NonD family hydrolase